MFKRVCFAPLYLVLVGLLAGCNFSIHAKNVQPVTESSVHASASPGINASAVTSTSPVVEASAASADTPIVSASASAPVPPAIKPPVASSRLSLPPFQPDAGMQIAYKVVGSGSKVIDGQFPAAPGFSLHVSCRGNGSVQVQIGSQMLATAHCPNKDEVGNYYLDPIPAVYYGIRVTTQGSIIWRVVVENQE